jgi:hypothetical protein
MLVAAGATVSGGLWLLSTEAEDVTLGLAAHLAVARSLIMLAPGGHAGAQASWRLGAMIGGATLAYASNALDRELRAEDRVIAAGNVYTFMRYSTGRDGVRVDERGGLEAAVSTIRAQPGARAARLLIAGFELDTSERTRWQAHPVWEDLGRRVWELRSPIEAE